MEMSTAILSKAHLRARALPPSSAILTMSLTPEADRLNGHRVTFSSESSKHTQASLRRKQGTSAPAPRTGLGPLLHSRYHEPAKDHQNKSLSLARGERIMLRYGLALGVLLLTCLSACAAPTGQWIVVTAPVFRKAIEPLCEQRKAQGLRVVVVQTTDVLSAEEIRGGEARKLREHINKLCREHKGPSFVLLVGAIESGRLAEPEKKVVPALSGTIGRMKGQPSDNGYGCFKDSRVPTVAVGRFPARTEEEARGMVAKTLDFERDARPGMWRRRLTILAGIPAYNPLVDRLVENVALSRFARLASIWTGKAIYSNPQSRFCLPNDQLHKRALQYVQHGEAFTLYLGHSSAEGLYGGEAPYLDRDDWAHLRIERGKGVFLTFGCNGCQLKGANGEGYGVAAMRNANGPVAVVGSHGICFAAMVQLAADGLFASTFANRPPDRLG